MLEAVTAARVRATALHDPTPQMAAAEARLGAAMGQAVALGEAYRR